MILKKRSQHSVGRQLQTCPWISEEDDDEGGDKEDEEDGDGFGLGECIWHGDDEIDMNIAL
jgi:hypothetical protein